MQSRCEITQRKLYFDHNKIFGRHKLVPTLRSGKVSQIWYFSMFLLNFATAISKFDTFSSYHIVRTRIAKVTNCFPFFTIGISMYQKRILPYFIIPYFFTPSFFPFGAFRTDRRTDNILHPPLPNFFFFSTERAGPDPQAQLYWAGRTMGWMADWTRYHKYARVGM